jgi:DNA-binding MarR family transcriptional regulator
MTHPPHDPLGFKVLNEIGIIAQLSGARFAALLPEGLSLAGFTTLNHLVRLGDGKTPVQLARAFQVTKATMTHTLQRLESRRLIVLRADPTDGRSKRVDLTPAGRAMREDCIARLAPTLQALDQDLADADLPAVLPALSRLRVWLDRARD